jgi:hypothetical protein
VSDHFAGTSDRFRRPEPPVPSLFDSSLRGRLRVVCGATPGCPKAISRAGALPAHASAGAGDAGRNSRRGEVGVDGLTVSR